MGSLGLYVDNGAVIRLNYFKKAVSFKRVFKCLASQDEDFDALLGLENGLFRPTYLNEMPTALDGNRICISACADSGSSYLRQQMEYLTGVVTGSDAPLADSQQY
jgi:hypothetical protein